jgi:hypothetical protein
MTPQEGHVKHPVGRQRASIKPESEPTEESGLELAANREGTGDRNSDRHALAQVR